MYNKFPNNNSLNVKQIYYIFGLELNELWRKKINQTRYKKLCMKNLKIHGKKLLSTILIQAGA